jgi:hypothetical protein
MFLFYMYIRDHAYEKRRSLSTIKSRLQGKESKPARTTHVVSVECKGGRIRCIYLLYRGLSWCLLGSVLRTDVKIQSRITPNEGFPLRDSWNNVVL